MAKSRTTKKRVRKPKLDTQHVLHALRKANGNKVETARLLDVYRTTLCRFLESTDLKNNILS
jgi:alpha-D-ribose 1-methylphosphonate 5-triphosphate synthase subunit PhnI